MAQDSLVRTRQLNRPELSGYVVDIILQYLKTGTGIATGFAINTGQLTGSFYPLRENPSGYAPTGILTGYATRQDLSGNNTYLLSYIDNTYYSRANESGFVTLAFLNHPDGNEASQTPYFIRANYDNYSGFNIYDVNEGDGYIIQANPGEQLVFGNDVLGRVINVFDVSSPNMGGYISGLDIYAKNLTATGINGEAIVTPTWVGNNYIPWWTVGGWGDDAFKRFSVGSPEGDGAGIYVTSDMANPTNPGLIIIGRDLLDWEKDSIIDGYGNNPGYSYPTGHPFIGGFNIYADKIQVSGKNVLTSGDIYPGESPPLASYNQLLLTSGQLHAENVYYRYGIIDMLDQMKNAFVIVTGDQLVDGVKKFTNSLQVGLSGEWVHILDVGGEGMFSSGRIWFTSGGDIVLTTPNFDKGIFLGNDGGATFASGQAAITREGIFSGDGSMLYNLTLTGYNIVFQTGNQTISGAKRFVDANTYARKIADVNTSGYGISLDGHYLYMPPTDYQILNWVTDKINDSIGGNLSIDWSGRTLHNLGGLETLNWNSRALTGSWTLNGQPISTGGSITDLSSSGFATTGWVVGWFASGKQTGIVYTTGNQDITGNKNFVGQLLVSGQPVSTGGNIPPGVATTGWVTGWLYSGGYLTGCCELGLPTDGTYGGINGAIAGVTSGDRTEDAFDKIEVILGKLAPSKPFDLSNATFGISGTTYTAYMQGTPTAYSNVVNSLRVTGVATGFYNADTGTLSGAINGALTGLRILTTGSDVGTYTGLQILTDKDFWSGVAGKAGFWNYIDARVFPTGDLPTGKFTLQMFHSQTGPSTLVTGYCERASTTMNASSLSVTTGACTTRTIDGVISLAAGDPINIRFNATNCVTAFYANPIANLDGPNISSTNIPPTGNPVSGQALVLSGTCTADSNTFTTGAGYSMSVYNSIGTVGGQGTFSNVRIDTKSNQQAQRATAGIGQYPTTNYNQTYNNLTSLTGNEELQMIDSSIQYPPAINYGVSLPSGANYTLLPSGTLSGFRWALFNFGTITDRSSITVNFNNTSNFGPDPIMTGYALYVKVSGAQGTNGWIDGNATYPGGGNPTNDGDPALAIGLSNATTKYITFGSPLTRSGPVYIRVGLKSGSNRSFGTITTG